MFETLWSKLVTSTTNCHYQWLVNKNSVLNAIKMDLLDFWERFLFCGIHPELLLKIFPNVFWSDFEYKCLTNFSFRCDIRRFLKECPEMQKLWIDYQIVLLCFEDLSLVKKPHKLCSIFSDNQEFGIIFF